MKTPHRIVIVDNDPDTSVDFRAALEMQPDLRLVADVTCASCSFGAVSSQRPDLVLLRLNLPARRVLELVKDLRVLHADVKFLIVSAHEEDLEASQVLRAGAHGCVPRSCSTATQVEAVRQVLAGHHFFALQPPHRPALVASPNLSFHWASAAAATL